MARLYGMLQGDRGQVTRCGGSSLDTDAASWSGCISVSLRIDKEGNETFSICQRPWHGNGISEEIASGTIGEPCTAQGRKGLRDRKRREKENAKAERARAKKGD